MSDSNKTKAATPKQPKEVVLPPGYTEQDIDGVLEANYLAAVLVGLTRQEVFETMPEKDLTALIDEAMRSSIAAKHLPVEYRKNYHDRFADTMLDIADRFEKYKLYNAQLEEDQIRRFKGEKFRDLKSVAYNAANTSPQRNFRSDKRRKKKECSNVTVNQDGEEMDIMSLSAPVESFENNVLLRNMIEDVFPKVHAELDDMDKTILAGMIVGATERKIAEVVSLSNSAVHKRIVKIRQRLVDAGLER